MDALQHSNKRILFNLLPAHVATHFLDNQFRSNMVTSEYKQPFNLAYLCSNILLLNWPFQKYLAHINSNSIKYVAHSVEFLS